MRDIYGLSIDEPFLELFTQGMITHKTYKGANGKWLQPSEVVIRDGELVDIFENKKVVEGPIEKMSKSKRNTIEPKEILENYGLDATRIFMISDSPPERNLEWTEQGIQGSKNLINRILKYFENEENKINEASEKKIKIFIHNMNKNILAFTFNKCVAEIYTLLNHLEKEKAYIGSSEYGLKILSCLFPIIPSLVEDILLNKFKETLNILEWPVVGDNEIQETVLKLPIQINGKFIMTTEVENNYKEEELLKLILKIKKINDKIGDIKIKKIVHVQNKIINIII